VSTFSPVLLGACLTVLILWVALSAYILADRLLDERRRRILRKVAAALENAAARGLALEDRLALVEPHIARSSRRLVRQVAVDPATPPWAFELFSTYLVRRWGSDDLVREASSHRGERQKRRRIAALRILAQGQHADALALLERALAANDPDLVGVAVTLLGSRTERRAAELLVSALGSVHYSASRVATSLDQFPIPILELLRPLLRDERPTLRFWGATLLARYGGAQGLDDDLAALSGDAEASVRKAAVESLGKVGGPKAAASAVLLLNDAVWYVRAHAARALGDLGRVDLADRIAPLLSDREWWVRAAAKEALETLGPDSWADLVPYLDHPDPFARNGAAEVFQNLGILDSLVVIEAATDEPGAAKIEMLRKIATAGGLRMTDALLERAGPQMRPRIRRLLGRLGLERAGSY
jgi:HEAT repeat protein